MADPKTYTVIIRRRDGTEERHSVQGYGYNPATGVLALYRLREPGQPNELFLLVNVSDASRVEIDGERVLAS